jgi:rsbT co-antagonist protein RsbR
MVAFAGYPLIIEERLVGVMAMFTRHALTEIALEAMSSIANGIALGVKRKRAEDELRRAHAEMEARVEERTAALSKANAVLEEQIAERQRAEQERAILIREQIERERVLEELSTPVVPVWRGVLVLPIVGSLDTARMEYATRTALNEVTRTGAHACIIDITGARIVDTHAVANLSNLVAALRLVGAEAIVTGVTAHAAQSLVNLGLDLKGMRTHRTLAQALSTIINRMPATATKATNYQISNNQR